MPLQWRNQFWHSLEEGAGKRCWESGAKSEESAGPAAQGTASFQMVFFARVENAAAHRRNKGKKLVMMLFKGGRPIPALLTFKKYTLEMQWYLSLFREGGGGGGVRARVRARARVCICVCVDHLKRAVLTFVTAI